MHWDLLLTSITAVNFGRRTIPASFQWQFQVYAQSQAQQSVFRRKSRLRRWLRALSLKKDVGKLKGLPAALDRRMTRRASGLLIYSTTTPPYAAVAADFSRISSIFETMAASLPIGSSRPGWLDSQPNGPYCQSSFAKALLPRLTCRFGQHFRQLGDSPATWASSFLKLKAVHTHNHSVRTFSKPRSKNLRTPRMLLIMANGVSAMCMRWL